MEGKEAQEKPVEKQKRTKTKKRKDRKTGPTSHENETRVQATNDDSIVSKRSAAREGYVEDEYLRYFVHKPQVHVFQSSVANFVKRRSPLINRGYYIRCSAIRSHLDDFFTRNRHRTQVVSLGAGFDTSFFVFTANENLNNCTYFEIDFANVVQRKSKLIEENLPLSSLIKNKKPNTQHEIVSDNYVLIEGDLRNLTQLTKKLTSLGLDLELPTLFFAECVLTYMEAEFSSSVIQWVADTFKHCEFVAYEQLLPDDAFGQVMCDNLTSRGSPLLGVHAYPTLSSQRNRYLKLGFESVTAVNMNEYWMNILDRKEAERVDTKEMFDEEEEWKMKCAHYFIVHAYKGTKGAPSSTLPNAPSQQESSKDESQFKWSQNVTTTGKNSQAKRWGHSTVLYENNLVVFGGYGGSKSHGRLNDVSLLNIASLEWSEPMISGMPPSGRVFHTATRVKDRMYVFGGRAAPEAPFNDMHILNLSSLTWSPVHATGELPPARFRHSANLVGSKIIVFGGRGAKNAFNDCYSFDTESNTWTKLQTTGEIPEPRYSHGSEVINEKLIIFGGMKDSFNILGDVMMLDLNTMIWSKVITTGTPPPPLFSLTCTMYNQLMIVIGGYSPLYHEDYPSQNEVYVLDVEKMHWSRIKLETPKKFLLLKHTATLVDQKIFIVGGGILCFSFGSFFSPLSALLLDGKEIQVQKIIPEQNQPTNSQKIVKQKKFPLLKQPKEKEEILRIHNPSLETFLNEIYPKRRPVILTGVSLGKCTSQWTPEHLKKMCGDKEVSVHASNYRTMDFINKNFVFKNMNFADFIERVFKDNGDGSKSSDSGEERYYLRSIGTNPRKDVSDIYASFPEIANEFNVPECVPMASVNNKKHFSSAFRISSKDIQMWTHYDIMDNVLCEIVGRKRIVLWAPNEVGHLYVSGSTSRVLDIDNPDLNKFPKFAKAKSMECILGPGEVLFIPSLWFHNVLTYEPCVAVNVFWKHLEDDIYEKKDLYGNKDLLPGDKALKSVESILSSLSQLPEYYREFYARKLIASLKSSLSL